WLPSSVRPTLVMLLILMPAVSSAKKVNCSEPNQVALLEGLRPLFNLSAIRPVMNTSTCTYVGTYFIMYGILGVWWENEFVSWDPIQCGSEKITLPRTKFWVPDIVIDEFMDEDTAPLSQLHFDFHLLPHRWILCFSILSSQRDVKITMGRSAKEITDLSKRFMSTMGEWELLEITSYNDSSHLGSEDGDELKFYVAVRRRATLYVVNLLLPSCFLITVDLFSFLMPPQDVDRSSFKMTLILGYTVFLLIMNDLLPVTGNTIPLINVFFCLCLALMVTSVVESILITNLLVGSGVSSPIPTWVQVLVIQILGRLVFLTPKTKEPRDAEMKPNAVVAQGKPDDEFAEEMGPVVEDKALQELKSISENLQAIRLQVDQQLSGSEGSKD
ncbi:5-hydroxytryptamine receptor 3C-like, partial [Anoplopoma fimbria]|uniref:5-hydroxytryptamine receptor 3C-like n=1 Tax=Anoplopoma fimbria TaxID=229290 RepID=UPI0023EAA649